MEKYPTIYYEKCILLIQVQQQDNHFQYDTFQKMRVCLAMQRLSESVAKGLEHVLRSGYFIKKTEEHVVQSTNSFVRNMNILFNIMNAKLGDDSNEYKRGVSVANIYLLRELYEYVRSFKQLDGSHVY